MRRVTEPLAAMGARFTEEAGDGLPLIVHGGRLEELAAYDSVNSSAQVKTALFLAGYTGGVPVSLLEPIPSRDHTERMFRTLGQNLERTSDGILQFLPGSDMTSFDITIPGDISSAAFMISAVLLSIDQSLVVEGVGLNPTRTGFLKVIERMGASVEVLAERNELGEPVADLLIRSSALKGTEVRSSEIPSLIDEIPVLAILASRAEGETSFEGVGELRFKESDRLGLLTKNLAGIGVEACGEGDSMTVAGDTNSLSGHIETHGDHRIAMAFSVLETMSNVELTLSERASPSVSYPMFDEHLECVVKQNG
jgi:3-phosphoshikimate 1-carboxyvinyltransferase